MIRINTISNNKAWYRYIKNPCDYIENKVDKINCNLKKYKKKKIFCTLLLSGNDEIKRLNKKFRNKNLTTDVLSFPFYNKKVLKNKLKKENEI
ncbi:MAG: rRNA maturation RNAse YbeY, partial [Pseudomonadota bacterium]|nr:rRNA maturation RNAse YbeY [Pseudomonadota bacterium]